MGATAARINLSRMMASGVVRDHCRQVDTCSPSYAPILLIAEKSEVEEANG